MFDEFKKSVNSVLYERTVSPLFGTFAMSWIICNWKIFVILFFVEEKYLEQNKVSYILKNFNDELYLVYIPIISTIILLTIIPFISNGAFWLSLKFEKWKYDKKNEVESKKLLTVEQSIKLREEIQNQQDKFEKILESKNKEIETLSKQLEMQIKLPIDNDFESFKEENLNPEFLEIFNDEEKKENFARVVWKIQNNYPMFSGSDSPKSTFVSFLEANDFIENSGGKYKFTKLGKELLKVFSSSY